MRLTKVAARPLMGPPSRRAVATDLEFMPKSIMAWSHNLMYFMTSSSGFPWKTPTLFAKVSNCSANETDLGIACFGMTP